MTAGIEMRGFSGIETDASAWHAPRRDLLTALPETTITPEVVQFIEGIEEAAHLHGYQPIRTLRFEGGETIYDITAKGFPLDSWTSADKPIFAGVNAKVTAECYGQIVDRGILQSPLVGAHMHPSIMDWLKVKRPDVWKKTHGALKEKPGFAVPPTQLALPTMPDVIEDLAIDIGIEMHKQDYGKNPLAFWPPELLVNPKTVDKLAQRGIKILILGRNQIKAAEEAPLYYVPTTSGRLMFVLPYNHSLSHTMADESSRLWADKYGDQIENESHGNATLVAVDEETIGHHHGPNSLRLAEYLVNTELPRRIGDGRLSFQRTIEKAKPATLPEEMTSWSCEHNGGRWTGENGCYDDGIDEGIRQEKQSLYQELYAQACTIIEGLDALSETTQAPWQQEFMTWYIDQRYNIATGEPISVENVREEYQESFKLLLTAMLGLQSCAFFFKGDFERGVARNARDYIRSHKEREKPLAA